MLTVALNESDGGSRKPSRTADHGATRGSVGSSAFEIPQGSRNPNTEYIPRTIPAIPTSTPQLPFKRPQIPSNGDHKALN